jgi:hypothetical protein
MFITCRYPAAISAATAEGLARLDAAIAHKHEAVLAAACPMAGENTDAQALVDECNELRAARKAFLVARRDAVLGGLSDWHAIIEKLGAVSDLEKERDALQALIEKAGI